MKVPVETAPFLVPALMAFAGCTTGMAVQPLSKAEVERIIIQEKIERVSNIEQQPQDDGTVGLLVTGNLRETSFAGCMADRVDIELIRSGQGWSISSKNTFAEVALVPCKEAENTGFASVDGDFSAGQLDQAAHYLRQLLAGSIPPEMVSSESSELRDAVKFVDLHEVQSVFRHENGGVEFQIVSSAISPRLLGIRLSIAKGQLERVSLNADNSIEVVEGDAP